MKFRKLGRTELSLSRVGIGTWEMSGDVWGKKDNATSVEAILTGIRAGANFIDTAAGYGKGHAERLVATALRQLPSSEAAKILVSTKILPKNGIFAPPPQIQIQDAYPRQWIIDQTDESLKRLERETIDILFLHTWSRAWGHETEWLDALHRLKQSGKVKAIGISIPDEGIADANVAVALEQIDVIQCVYNVFQQEPEHVLFPLAKKHNVGIIARSPFSSGALSQNWSDGINFEEGDWRATWPLSVKPNWLQDQAQMATLVGDLFQNHSLARVEASLGYILANPDVTSVIPGSANPSHVKQNITAIEAPILPDLVQSKLRELWRMQKLHGTYNGSI